VARPGHLEGRPGLPANALGRVLRRQLLIGLTVSAAVVGLGAGSASAVATALPAKFATGDGRLAAAVTPTGQGRVYTFRGVRFDWRPQGAYYRQTIAGRVCGRAGLGAWRLAVTATSYVDPSNSGTVHVRIAVKKPRTSTRGTGTYGRYLRLTILPGSSLAIRVQAKSTAGSHTATVPVYAGARCSLPR
jgi:hypothetical protein